MVAANRGNGLMNISGTVDERFAPVRAAFERNFLVRGELGGACAAYFRGEKVVDLWGGYREPAAENLWEEDTLCCVFSTTKGMSAVALAVAHSRRWFELDEPVANYWPEFAKRGKQDITVRQLLAHQAGLSAIDEPLNPDKLADLDYMAEVTARQKPAWKPGSRHGYHGLSLGFFQNEFVRRIDPKHRSIGRFFQDEVAGPLGAEFYIHLPSSFDERRLAVLKAFHPAQMLLHMNTMPMGMVASLALPWSLTHRSLLNPRMKAPADIAGPDYRSVQFPSASGFGTARAIAKIYGSLANGGGELEIDPHTLRALEAPPVAPTDGNRDLVIKVPTAYSCGFWKPCPPFRFGTNEKAFGGQGAGGSIGFADPELNLGFSYVPNKMGFYMFNDPREEALRKACMSCARAVS